MAKKTTCPISRATFLGKAPRITVQIGDTKFDATPREFSTGSLGWNINAKMTVDIDGVAVPVQVGLNLTVVGSKELPPSEGAQPAAAPPAAAAEGAGAEADEESSAPV